MGSPAARVLRLAAALLGGMCGGSAIRSAITGSGHWPWLTAAALTLIGAAAAATCLAHRATRRSLAAQRATLEHLRRRIRHDYARALADIEALEKRAARKGEGTQP